ncbi:helix-turn-helix transcriptional regulator [Mycolicibacterium pulveris]|nr:helix-turn-helix transcriptional regulator [Mycolicibacterium pulveris]
MAPCDDGRVTAEPIGVGRRERRKARAREKLLTAGRQLIAESGVSGLRIGDVTDRADLGFGTFYTYFESKEALVEAVVADTLAGLASSIGATAVAAPDAARAAAEAYRRFLRFATAEPELARVVVELDRADAAFEEAVRPWARETLEHGCASGQFKIEDVELALVSISAAALAAIRAILSGLITPGPTTESRGAEMMLRGFGVDATAAREIAWDELPDIDAPR